MTFSCVSLHGTFRHYSGVLTDNRNCSVLKSKSIFLTYAKNLMLRNNLSSVYDAMISLLYRNALSAERFIILAIFRCSALLKPGVNPSESLLSLKYTE